ncbi:hypothetical protein PFICI_11108 [Pestalotiopsis fici W106-1]|uniref:Uncharacterized protein n=1 Tax=Pestalotiopsis fici (strain W106-1 / CGMCC3.15140) TaxID=1229662 RepID=W3WTX5_PESFW|nr:uncharacterized protein PFICI_11108 [Pestalotiopsis fici W106-1]ETS77234.1 hypothetical protein PFICI_11108 [Pestalotiopsis fici W106-1]
MRAIHALTVLATAVAALPTSPMVVDSVVIPRKLTGDVKVDAAIEPEVDAELLSGKIQTLFTATCHNICIKIYSQPGALRDKCMDVCREYTFFPGFPND